jgi:RNA polymerase sigma-70 factor (ECF subfamily)
MFPVNHTLPTWNMSEWSTPIANADTSLPVSEDEDVRLMLRVKQGDTRAFEQLVEIHQRSVIGTVMRMLNNLDDAHDVAQQVFVRVWRSAPRYEPSAKFTTWLFTITRNLVFNEMRRRGRKREVSIESAKEDHNVEPASPQRVQPDASAEREELEAAIDRAIQSLPEKQRLAVTLRRHEDMPYEDICTILNMSLPAVKSLLFRARNELKEKLAPHLEL